jgi:hypothetical protein
MVCAQEFLFNLREILENGTASDVLTYFSNPEIESLEFENLLEHITQESVRCNRYLDHLEFFSEPNFNFINTEFEVNLEVVLQPYRYASPTPRKLKMGAMNGIILKILLKFNYCRSYFLSWIFKKWLSLPSSF